MTPQEHIMQFLNQTLEDTDCYLVDFKVKPTNNYKFYIDSDTGLTLEKCMKINRSLRRKVEEAELYPDGDISIEVSSPGVDVPLRTKRQFVKNIGRKLEIELQDEEANGIIGKLIEVSDEGIKLEKTQPSLKGRKVAVTPVEIIELTFDQLKVVTVLVEF